MPSRGTLLVGGGGHCRSVLSAMLAQGESPGGIVDDKLVGSHLMGVPVLGADEDLIRLFAQDYSTSIITIGSVGSNRKRVELFEKLESIGFAFPAFLARSATIQSHTEILGGTVVLENALVNTGVRIGKNVIINSGAIVEHDTTIGDHCHIAPGSIVCGDAIIGHRAFLGAGSTTVQGIVIGDDTIVGAGSVVLEDLPSGVFAAGCPAKVLRQLSP